MIDFFFALEIVFKILNDDSEGVFIRFIAGKCLKKDWNAMLFRYHTEYKTFKIPASVFWVTIGDLHLSCIKIGFIFPGYAEISRINMNAMGTIRCGNETF